MGNSLQSRAVEILMEHCTGIAANRGQVACLLAALTVAWVARWRSAKRNQRDAEMTQMDASILDWESEGGATQ